MSDGFKYQGLLGDYEGEDDKDGAPRTFNGVVTGTVIRIDDPMFMGRVQVQLPFLDSLDPAPWARVALPMAGTLHSAYFVPSPGDQVLVAFEHGDSTVPYVIGCVHHALGPPPYALATDALTKRLIRTPTLLELEFDDELRSITLNTQTQTVKLSPKGVEITNLAAPASVTVGSDGSVSIKAAKSIALSAAEVTIEATTVTIKGGTVAVKAARRARSASRLKVHAISTVRWSISTEEDAHAAGKRVSATLPTIRGWSAGRACPPCTRRCARRRRRAHSRLPHAGNPSARRHAVCGRQHDGADRLPARPAYRRCRSLRRPDHSRGPECQHRRMKRLPWQIMIKRSWVSAGRFPSA